MVLHESTAVVVARRQKAGVSEFAHSSSVAVVALGGVVSIVIDTSVGSDSLPSASNTVAAMVCVPSGKVMVVPHAPPASLVVSVVVLL